MTYCKTFKFGGLGECDALRDSIQGMVVMDKGTTISLANAGIIGADSTGWASILAPLVATSTYEKGILIDFIRGYEVTTAEAEMTASNLLYEDQTNEPLPKMVAYGKMGYEDYKTFFRAHGKTFDIALIAANGDPIMTETSTINVYKGFRGRIFVNKGSIPKTGADKQKDIEFRVIFSDVEEWENIVQIDSAFTFSDLLDLVPVGLYAKVTTAYASPTVTIQVLKRGSNQPYADIGAGGTEIQIVEALNDATVAVVSVDVTNAALGVYVVTLTASLNGPVWARISDESTNRDYVSQMFKIVG